MNYCGQCGNKLSDEDLFCTACGYKTTQSQPEIIAEDLYASKPADSENFVPQNTFPYQEIQKPKRKYKKSTFAIVWIAMGVFTIFFIYLLFGEQIGVNISNLWNSGVTVSFEAQIPGGETEEKITDNMKRIADITKHRLTALGYGDATVSVDDNTLTVKHIPQKADIDAVTNYIASSDYTAAFQDSDGNTVLDASEFTSATAIAGADSSIKYEISIQFNTETREKFSNKVKELAALEDDKNYLALIINGKVVLSVSFKPERAQSGWEKNEINLSISDDETLSDLTPEELAKALNSGGKLPYALTNIKISGGTGSASKSDETIANANKRGNTIGNISNGGVVAQQGDWIYYYNSTDGGRLYKIKTDDTEETPLSSMGNVHNINVIGDWVYFGADYHGILKVKTDGNGETELSTDHCNRMNVLDGWIYYINTSDNNRIYKIKTNGKDRTMISDVSVNGLAVFNGWIYYGNKSDSALCRMKTDGSSASILSDKGSGTINIEGERLYFTNGNGSLYSSALDGSNVIKHNDGWDVYGEYNKYVNGFNINGTTIWFINEDNIMTNSISCVILGQNKFNKIYTKIGIWRINLAGDHLYFSVDGEGVWRINKDGSGLMKTK